VIDLLEAIGNVAIIAGLIGALLWSLHFAFGPQAFGLPAMLCVVAVVAGLRIFSNSSIGGVIAVVLGLVAAVLVIGMAMTLGGGRPPQQQHERPPDEP
jgi:hypothetical protein